MSFFAGMMKGTVIQLSNGSEEVQQATATQLANLRSALPELTIELVLHGDAIESVLNENEVADELWIWRNLPDLKVDLLACRNSLNSRQLSPSDVISVVKIISSAVAHLVIRQQEGWSYLKAGY